MYDRNQAFKCRVACVPVFTIFQLIEAFFLTLFYMFQYDLNIISYACQVYLLHCLYILLVKPTD